MQLSVIIPVYNVENYLDECLKSVLAIRGIDYEVICINDGSTDSSLGILNRYEQNYNKVRVYSFENGGLSEARNRGLRLATGDYIFFLDSDDYIIGDLKRVFDAALLNSVDVIGFDALRSNDIAYLDHKIDFAEISIAGSVFVKSYYEKYNSFPGAPVWLYIYKREFLLNNELFFKKGLLSEDEHFTYKVLNLAKKIVFINERVVYYRLSREGAITNKPDIKRSQSLTWIASDLYSFLTGIDCKERIIYLKILKLYFAAVRFLIDTDNISNRKYLITGKDLGIMKQCVPDEKWYVRYWLYHYVFTLYVYYVNEKNSAYIRALISNVVKAIYRLNS